MADYEVQHTETALVEADSRSEARVKAVEGDTKTGWSSSNYKARKDVLGDVDPVKVRRIRGVIERLDDLEDEEMDMDSAISLIRDIVDDGGDFE